MEEQLKNPYLSVVTVSRNDNHGGDPLRRTQFFINSLSWQAEHYRLSVELVLVDWNPPDDRPPLAAALDFPAGDFFSARIVSVPQLLHNAYRYADIQSLFQMIGKNVGIRRARGEYVLATNIDILLDDAIFSLLAERVLQPDRMYRADRFDIESMPDDDHLAQQKHCRDPQNHIRRNGRAALSSYRLAQEKDPLFSAGLLETTFLENNRSLCSLWQPENASAPLMALEKNVPVAYLNTNGCGDFTLMHREAWAAIGGYGEFEAFSMHIDSIGCATAHYAGFVETSFLPPAVCYHLEHSKASGWTSDDWAPMYAMLDNKGLPYFEIAPLSEMLLKTIEQGKQSPLNNDEWGLKRFQLEEVEINAQGRVNHPAAANLLKDDLGPFFGPVAAINPRFEPQILTVKYLKRNPEKFDQTNYQKKPYPAWLYLIYNHSRLLLKRIKNRMMA